MTSTLSYPESRRERDLWVLHQRTGRNPLDPLRPYGYFREHEIDNSGHLASTAVILLTNRECPWRCLMCDLWKNTLADSVPLGAIVKQVDFAMNQVGPAEVVKLYNSGSFFDPHAIPPEDYSGIALRLHGSRHIVVESHPALVGHRTLRFQDLWSGTMEVALGLETAHPVTLEKLNKGMTLEQFAAAAAFLRNCGIAVRAFVIVKPPFTGEDEAEYWGKRSIDFAFECGAGAVSLIPARPGNGAMDTLEQQGDFQSPLLTTVEKVMNYGIAQKRGRVFVDLWNSQHMRSCPLCHELRTARLRSMNETQNNADPVSCEVCQHVPATV